MWYFFTFCCAVLGYRCQKLMKGLAVRLQGNQQPLAKDKFPTLSLWACCEQVCRSTFDYLPVVNPPISSVRQDYKERIHSHYKNYSLNCQFANCHLPKHFQYQTCNPPTICKLPINSIGRQWKYWYCIPNTAGCTLQVCTQNNVSNVQVTVRCTVSVYFTAL